MISFDMTTDPGVIQVSSRRTDSSEHELIDGVAITNNATTFLGLQLLQAKMGQFRPIFVFMKKSLTNSYQPAISASSS